MFRLTLRNLAANKARFAMTTFAVVLGVGFVVASFVLSDGLRSTFNDLSEEITDGTDLVVRPVSTFGEPIPLDEGLVAEVNAIDGVDLAVAFTDAPDNSVQPIKSDGSTISVQGPPQLTFSWTGDEELGSFTVVDGEAPDEQREFTMDFDAAEKHDFVLGETYDLVTPIGIEEDFTLVGTTRFGEDNTTVGATLMHVSLDEAQRLWGTDGTVDAISIRLDNGADTAAVTGVIGELIGGSNVEVVDNATITEEEAAEYNDGITIIGNVLLGFAIVSLFVSIFIIYNTFAIVLGQRIREIGLLRAIGANSTQIRRSIIAEAMLVGVVASAIGIAAGIGLAEGLKALFGLLGADLPASPTILAARTVIIASILGIAVTVISAIAPARTAAAITPIQALRDGGDETGNNTGRRLGVGVTGLLAGLGLGAYGLFGSVGSTLGVISVLGLAAVCIFLGVTLAAPTIADPVTRVISWPIRKMFGRAGVLASENAARNPRRTATTGAALMIGLSLVTTGYVVGESLKASLGDLIEESVSADYVITDQNDFGLTQAIADDLTATGTFEAVSGMRYEEASLQSATTDGQIMDLTAMDVGALESLFNVDITQGSVPADSSSDVVLVHSDIAADLGVGVGDTITAEFATGYSTDLNVVAVYEDQTIFDVPIVPDHVFDEAGVGLLDDWVAAVLADGVTLEDAAPSIARVQAQYPQVSIQTSSEFQQSFEEVIDQMLVVINALLALAVIIALIGIANTLALSVHERTREIGLLRAVGMTRRQTRRMVRWEAAIVAMFGAVLGVAVGLVFGWGVVSALPEDDIGGSVAFPMVSILRVALIATAATLLAAWLPARRAGKLNVLDAISH